MENMTFVCLSKSLKNSDYCVAGKIINADGSIGGWIRPLNKFGSINDHDCLYQDKSYASCLDIITATFIQAIPEKFQTENYLIDSEQDWKKENEYSSNIACLNRLCDQPSTLWFNNHMSRGGLNDQISPNEANQITNSLYFIYVDNITFHTSKWDTKLKVRGEFTYNGIDYNLKVTDIFWLNYFKDKELGTYPFRGKYVTVSLALDTFGGFHYKLIAKIM
ncbi:dual OB domain-containing protein [Xenorhabdus bovienii]|uniref:dual OB domain-containing protein n=1 Tax=Xenorhabdus bovienii TaxID=40576 RepID=UPI0004D7E0C0|nr:hypothetical protein [Xenorhabdus bovienii]CDG88867.1 conserved hypothetical protein [Xenorhabdus bovienii str. feltiae France]CDG91068.1 conserved hypothetical protein [Xenorhabdus bovienii str. feltiae Florida]